MYVHVLLSQCPGYKHGSSPMGATCAIMCCYFVYIVMFDCYYGSVPKFLFRK